MPEQRLAEGECCSVNTLAQIMREDGLRAKGSKRFKPASGGDHGIEARSVCGGEPLTT